MSDLKTLLASKDCMEIIQGLKDQSLSEKRELWPLVEKLVEHPDRVVSLEAIQAMRSVVSFIDASFQPSQAGELLIRIIKNVHEDSVRKAAIEVLAAKGVTEAVEIIEQCATSRNSDLAVPAIHAMGRLKTARCIHFLIDLMSLEAPLLRNAACDALVEAGLNSVDGLVEQLNSSDPDLVVLSCNILGQIGIVETLNPLAQMFFHADANVRYAAIEAVGRIGSKRAIVKLATTLGDDDEQVKIATIQALQDIGDCAAVSAMIDHVSDSEQLCNAVVGAVLSMGCFEHISEIARAPHFDSALRDYLHDHQRRVGFDQWEQCFKALEDKSISELLLKGLADARGMERSGKRVLIADDSRAMRNYIRDILKDSFSITTAADGLEAFNHFRRGEWDLILTDMNMPRMDGITLVRRIRTQDTNIPVIMLTTESEQSDMNLGFSSGVNSYLTKPFNPEQLKMVIKTFVPDVNLEECGLEDLFFGSIDDDDDDQ